MDDKWDYSVMREMQNRIRILEMDNHLIKSQILSTNHEVRNAFIEFAEKMDRMERKLIQMFNPDRSFRMESSYPSFSSVDHRFNQFSDSSEFDAMAYVETVMHMEQQQQQQQQHAMQTNESKIMQQQQQGLNKKLKAKRRTVLQLATTSGSRQVPPNVSPMEPEATTDNNNQSETGEGEIGKAMFDCNFCGKSFRQSSGLSRHHKIHMRKKGYTVIEVEEPDVDSPTYDKKNRPKKFFCDYANCKASFISRSGMTKHLKNVHPTPLIPSTPPKQQPLQPRFPTNPRNQQQSNIRNNNGTTTTVTTNTNNNSAYNNKIVINGHSSNTYHVKVENDEDDLEELVTSAELSPNKDDVDENDMYDDNDNISQMSVTDDDEEEDKFGNDSESPRNSRISTPVSTP